MKPKYIYQLEKNEIPFYIGYTNNPTSRQWHHRKRLNDKNIKLSVIDYTDDYRNVEKYWIEQYKVWGYTLVNKNEGGGGPQGWWTKANVYESNKKYLLDPINKAKNTEYQNNYHKQYDKQYHLANKEKRNEYNRQYRARKKKV